MDVTTDPNVYRQIWQLREVDGLEWTQRVARRPRARARSRRAHRQVLRDSRARKAKSHGRKPRSAPAAFVILGRTGSRVAGHEPRTQPDPPHAPALAPLRDREGGAAAQGP